MSEAPFCPQCGHPRGFHDRWGRCHPHSPTGVEGLICSTCSGSALRPARIRIDFAPAFDGEGVRAECIVAGLGEEEGKPNTARRLVIAHALKSLARSLVSSVGADPLVEIGHEDEPRPRPVPRDACPGCGVAPLDVHRKGCSVMAWAEPA